MNKDIQILTERYADMQQGHAGIIPSDIANVLDDPAQLNRKLAEYRADYGPKKMSGLMRNLMNMYPEQMAAAGAQRGSAYKTSNADHEQLTFKTPRDPRIGAVDLPSFIRDALDNPAVLAQRIHQYKQQVGLQQTLEILQKLSTNYPEIYDRMTKVRMARSRVPAYESFLQEADLKRYDLTDDDFDDPGATEDIPTYCAWCGKHMRGPDLGPMDQAAAKHPGGISHGACPECFEKQMAQLNTMYN